jgi:hypothetical protein
LCAAWTANGQLEIQHNKNKYNKTQNSTSKQQKKILRKLVRPTVYKIHKYLCERHLRLVHEETGELRERKQQYGEEEIPTVAGTEGQSSEPL